MWLLVCFHLTGLSEPAWPDLRNIVYTGSVGQFKAQTNPPAFNAKSVCTLFRDALWKHASRLGRPHFLECLLGTVVSWTVWVTYYVERLITFLLQVAAVLSIQPSQTSLVMMGTRTPHMFFFISSLSLFPIIGNVLPCVPPPTPISISCSEAIL